MSGRKIRSTFSLDREIQEAFLAGETLIEIVHGIGEG
ncbi:DNA mismatch repair protein MutS, partial [Leptospira ellisii]